MDGQIVWDVFEKPHSENRDVSKDTPESKHDNRMHVEEQVNWLDDFCLHIEIFLEGEIKKRLEGVLLQL